MHLEWGLEIVEGMGMGMDGMVVEGGEKVELEGGEEVELEEGEEVESLAVEELLTSGSRIIRSCSPPLSNITSWDSMNFHIGQCIRQKVVHCCENLRKV